MNTTVQSAGDGDRYLRVSRGAVPISRIVAPPPVARVGLSKSMGAPELDAGKRNRRTRGIPQLTVPSETSANGNAYDKRTSKKAPLLDFVPLDDLNTTRRCSVESIRLRDLEKELYAELQAAIENVDRLEILQNSTQHHSDELAVALDELQQCRDNLAELVKLQKDSPGDDNGSAGGPMLNDAAKQHQPHVHGRAALYGANHHDVEALNERVAAYGELSIISALLVGAALATLVEGRTTATSGDAQIEAIAFIAEISASIVLAANIIGTAVILFQKHYTLGLMSRNFFLGANEGWDRGKPLRTQAVFLISWSLPGMLVSSAFFVIGGYEVSIGNWISFGVLMICAGLAALTVIKIKDDFAEAEKSNLLSTTRAVKIDEPLGFEGGQGGYRHTSQQATYIDPMVTQKRRHTGKWEWGTPPDGDGYRETTNPTAHDLDSTMRSRITAI